MLHGNRETSLHSLIDFIHKLLFITISLSKYFLSLMASSSFLFRMGTMELDQLKMTDWTTMLHREGKYYSCQVITYTHHTTVAIISRPYWQQVSIYLPSYKSLFFNQLLINTETYKSYTNQYSWRSMNTVSRVCTRLCKSFLVYAINTPKNEQRWRHLAWTLSVLWHLLMLYLKASSS